MLNAVIWGSFVVGFVMFWRVIRKPSVYILQKLKEHPLEDVGYRQRKEYSAQILADSKKILYEKKNIMLIVVSLLIAFGPLVCTIIFQS